ncbi:MAG TPA: sulfite exporter TauE/SafE family protein [Solirubrobacteraceae bacterium]|nr:sulfite exporter TauE/SafE family protein [Solirubrobacteraceae bacterium]
MHLDPYIILGSAVVGLLVGMTGAGGGALMTPMLILLFGVTPSSAISSDLVAAVLMRPLGAIVHMRAGTVNFKLVRWLVTGSVPSAFLGAYLLHALHNSSNTQTTIEYFLGAALLIGAAAMVLRFVIDTPFGARGRRGGGRRHASITEIDARPLPTLIVGVIGGVIVGMTSVGSGSLMVVALLFLYPMIGAGQLVGTDLTQAVPLTLAAACGALIFGHVEFGVTGSLIIGSVPAVFLGSLLSSSVPDRYVRPVIAFAIFASGLKYVQVPTRALGWVLCGTLLACGAGWLVYGKGWQRLPAARTAGAGEAPTGLDEPEEPIEAVRSAG